MSELIQLEASKIRRKFGGSALPVPVEQIAKMSGIRLETLTLDDELSGMSFVKDGVAVIIVNAAHHINRRRFTIAHELGHHILHSAYLRDNVHIDKIVLNRDGLSSDGIDLKEIQANNFAAELLMPETELKRLNRIDINDDVAVKVYAKRFKVSSAALTYRLINLGHTK